MTPFLHCLLGLGCVWLAHRVLQEPDNDHKSEGPIESFFEMLYGLSWMAIYCTGLVLIFRGACAS